MKVPEVETILFMLNNFTYIEYLESLKFLSKFARCEKLEMKILNEVMGT